MWFFPSRGRPFSVNRFFQAWKDTQADSEGVLWLDDDDYEKHKEIYEKIELPVGWKLVVAPNYNKGTGHISNLFFEMFPQEPWYGFMCDDVVPETLHWDRKLIEAAGEDGLSYGDDGINPEHASHPCVGGALIRSLGWLALPGLDRIYIDNALLEVAKRRGKVAYLPEVKTKHLHFSTGKSPFDETYRKTKNQQDKEIFDAWLKTLS